jgi:hypothetical protein
MPELAKEGIWRSCRSAVGASDPAVGNVAAPDPPIGLGTKLALELHEAPHLGPVNPHVRFDMGGRPGDGDQVDAEEFRAPLQRRGDRPSVGRVVRFPGPHDR